MRLPLKRLENIVLTIITIPLTSLVSLSHTVSRVDLSVSPFSLSSHRNSCISLLFRSRVIVSYLTTNSKCGWFLDIRRGTLDTLYRSPWQVYHKLKYENHRSGRSTNDSNQTSDHEQPRPCRSSPTSIPLSECSLWQPITNGWVTLYRHLLSIFVRSPFETGKPHEVTVDIDILLRLNISKIIRFDVILLILVHARYTPSFFLFSISSSRGRPRLVVDTSLEYRGPNCSNECGLWWIRKSRQKITRSQTSEKRRKDLPICQFPNKDSLWEFDGWVCDLETIDTPPISQYTQYWSLDEDVPNFRLELWGERHTSVMEVVGLRNLNSWIRKKMVRFPMILQK